MPVVSPADVIVIVVSGIKPEMIMNIYFRGTNEQTRFRLQSIQYQLWNLKKMANL
jgi:hypothetical protein